MASAESGLWLSPEENLATRQSGCPVNRIAAQEESALKSYITKQKNNHIDSRFDFWYDVTRR
jgi:hypothetical protein